MKLTKSVYEGAKGAGVEFEIAKPEELANYDAIIFT